MRRIMALVALAISAWYLSNRQRRIQLQGKWQEMVSSLLGAHRNGGPATPGPVADRVEQAAEPASGIAPEPVERVAGVGPQPAESTTGVAADVSTRALKLPARS